MTPIEVQSQEKVREFHLALLLHSSMSLMTRSEKGQVCVYFDGLPEAERLESALKTVLEWPWTFHGSRQGNLIDHMIATRLDQYVFEKIWLPILPEFEETPAQRWRFRWDMELPSTANDLYIRLQWLLDKNAVIV